MRSTSCAGRCRPGRAGAARWPWPAARRRPHRAGRRADAARAAPPAPRPRRPAPTRPPSRSPTTPTPSARRPSRATTRRSGAACATRATTPGINNLQAPRRACWSRSSRSIPGTQLTTAGEAWRQIRNWLDHSRTAARSSCIVVLALALYYFAQGPDRRRTSADTGRVIERFTLLRARRALDQRDRLRRPRGLGPRDGVRQVLPAAAHRRPAVRLADLALKTAHNFVGPLFAVSLVDRVLRPSCAATCRRATT